MTDIVYLRTANRAITQPQINKQNALLCIETRLRFDGGLHYLADMEYSTAETKFCVFFFSANIKLFYALF